MTLTTAEALPAYLTDPTADPNAAWPTDWLTTEDVAARLGDNQTAHDVWGHIIPLLDGGERTRRFREFVPTTPLLRVPGEALPADIQGTDHEIYLLAEGEMPTGAYKFRGVMSAILAAMEHEPDAQEVVAFSTGNHAAATALAATLLGLKSTVYMPNGAVRAKVENTEQYGAQVEFRSSLDKATDAAAKHGARKGSIFIHAFDQLPVIAGNGTATADLVRRDIDSTHTSTEEYVPVGGGGRATGSSVARAVLLPDMQTHLVQAQDADALLAVLRGEKLDPRTFNPAVDGAAVLNPGRYAADVLSAPGFVHGTHVVNRGEVGEAMAVTARFTDIYEPAGALALAAAIKAVRQDPYGRSIKIAHGTGINTTAQKVHEFATAAYHSGNLSDKDTSWLVSQASLDRRRRPSELEEQGLALATARRVGPTAVRSQCRVVSGR